MREVNRGKSHNELKAAKKEAMRLRSNLPSIDHEDYTPLSVIIAQLSRDMHELDKTREDELWDKLWTVDSE